MRDEKEIILDVINSIQDCECMINVKYLNKNVSKKDYGLKLLEVLAEELKKKYEIR